MAPHHFAFMVLICMIWGFNFVAGKVGLEQFPPLLFTGVRFAILGLILLPFLKLHPGRMRLILMITVFAGSLHFGLMFTALNISNASVIGIVSQLSTPFLTVLSIIFLGEVVRWRRWFALALAFGGVMIISFDARVVSHVEGIVLGSIAAFCIAGSMILMRRLKGVGPFELQAWVGATSAPVLLLASFLFEDNQFDIIAQADMIHWSAIAYTVFGASLIGHAGIYYLLQRYEASLTGPMMLMGPVFGVICAVLFLGETVTARFIIGTAVTLSGVLVIALRSSPPPVPAGPGTLPSVEPELGADHRKS